MRISVGWLVVASMLWACNKGETTPADERPSQLSNANELAHIKTPQKIISLAPNLTEMLFDLGAGNRLIGVTRYCNYPAAAQKLPRVGGYLDPSVETILSLKPDLVIAMTNPGLKSRLELLKKHNIAVLWLRVQSFSEVRQSYSVLGKALGMEAQARARLQAFDQAVKTHQRRLQSIKVRPKTLIVLGHRPMIVAGKGTFAGDLIDLAGGLNAASNSRQPYPQWSAETLLRSNPNIIIDAWMGDAETHPESERWREMKAISAVQSQRVHQWKDDSLLRPGPRLPYALARLIDLIHPEVAPSKH